MRKTLIDAVTSAFDLIDDLKTTITIVSNDKEFDFGTNSVITDNTANVTISGVILNIEKKDDTRGSIWKKILLKTSDLNNLKFYDKVQFEGETYSIAHPIKDNGYVTTIEVYQ